MSSLDKLAIRGIRSFDHNDLSIMQFYSPLTVIVGHNGSGKTTIIECLKYATTGDMPPNTKGGAFVHDPSIAGTNEVKAIVKLRFYNVKKEKMMVERRVMVTKKKTGTGLTLKTLEGVISYDDEDGSKSKKRTTLSTKCASLDEEVPMQLGVSRAILDNVIFCHQEESNWPLSEPAALKKKFDEIFEATKYTKALDQIRSLRKDQAVEIKVDKEKLSALRTDRDRADKLKKAIEVLSNSITVKEAANTKLEAEITQAVLENKNFYNQATKYSEILNKADTLKTQKTLTQQNLESIRSSISELPDSDNELAQKVQNHENDQQLMRTEREKTKQNLNDQIDRQSNFEKMRSDVQTQHGRLQADKQRYAINIAYRQTLIKELSIKHGIPGYDHDLTKEEMDEFDSRLTEGMNNIRTKISKMKHEARLKENELQATIQGLKSTAAADELAKRSKNQQVRAISARINEINRKIDGSLTTAQDVSFKQSELDDEKKRKTELQQAYRERDFPNTQNNKTRELKELEEKRETLHLELTTLNSQADVRAKLGLKKTELESKEKAIQTGLDKATLAFRRFKKADPLKETIESELTAVNDALTQDVRGAERILNEANRELQGVETSINLTKANIAKMKKDAEAAKTRISAGLASLDTDAETIAAAIEEAEIELVEASKELSSQEGAGKFFAQILAHGKKEEICLGCNRDLSKAELKEFEAHCKAQAQRAPAKLKECQEGVAEWEKQLQSLKRLLPLEASYFKIIKDDIPAAEKFRAVLGEKLEPARTKAQEALSQTEEIKNKIIDLQQLRRTAGDITRLVRECKDIDRDIVKLQSELSASGPAATPDDIQQQLTSTSETIRTIKAALEKLRSDSTTAQNKMQVVSEKVHTLEIEITVKKQEMKERDSLEQRKESERAEASKLEAEIKAIDIKIKEGMAPIRKLQEELEALQVEFTQNESNASQTLQTYNKSIEQLDVNAREIQSYIGRGSRAELEKCERELKKKEADVEETKRLVTELRSKLANIDKKLADSQGILRNFNDNLRIRKGVAEMKIIDREIEALDEEGAKKAHRNFNQKYTEMRQKQSDMSSAQSKLGGEIATMQVDLASKNDEMKSEYDKVHDKYRTELIKVKTAECANADLEKYAKALDKAIMDFHGHKMAEINSTIAELWTKTYQGTDIDKIMLKADSESKTITARNYNYRVVMLKDKSEMDMRGRCSAGQKVLASIVIRLALAESFGANCGIMALDEPTTNLDKQNVDALAAALSELIQIRKSQSNFQLIIITHDESFLATIGASGSVSKYWRVSRANGTGNSAGQVSTISREKLD